MKISYIISCIIIIIVASCKSLEKGTNAEVFKYDLKLEGATAPAEYENIVDSYQYVQLETDSNSLIGEIKKTLVSGNNLLVLSDGVICFDLKGKHRYSINSKGRGPSEFIQATDMSIDNNKLYLYDNYQYKIMIFDLESGSFLESFRMSFSAKEIQVSGNTLLCNRGSIPNPIVKNGNQLLISDRYDQEQILSYMPIDTPNLTLPYQFYGNDKQFYWIDPVFNKVYKIKNGQPTPYLHLDFGKLNISHREFSENLPLSAFSALGKAFFLSSCFETDELIYAKVQIGETPVDIWINKWNKHTVCLDKVNMKPYQFVPSAQCAANGMFYKIIPVLEVNFMKFNMLEKNFQLSPNEADYTNYRVIKDFREENNPVLAIYNMKI